MNTGASFSKLDAVAQRRALTSLAQESIGKFGLEGGKLTYIHSGENATFAYDSASPLSPALPPPFHLNRLLVRLHATTLKASGWITSESAWLSSLRSSGLVVPEPFVSPRGEVVEWASAGGLQRPCSLMRWIVGRRSRMPGARRLFLTGRLMAKMHEQACRWVQPRGFARRVWNWDELFGDGSNLAASAADLWRQVPDPCRKDLREVAERTRDLYPDKVPAGRPYGLVHGDLHGENTVAFRGDVYPIDFDDCGFAYHILDIANVLEQVLAETDFAERAAAFMRGYRSVREFPEEEWRLIGMAMAARCASNVLWLIDKAQTNALYRENLDKWIDDDLRGLDAALKIDAEFA